MILLTFACVFACVAHLHAAPDCRFASKYSVDALLNSESARDSFLLDIVRAEGKFHASGVGYEIHTGHTYDGHMLDYNTGLLLPNGLHQFSAPSKECLHVSMLALALDGNEFAQAFVTSATNSPISSAPAIALDLMTKKMAAYEAFNRTYPGYGGYMPWVNITNGTLTPANGWDHTVPALDNGELFWALFAMVQVLKGKGHTTLATRIQHMLDYQAYTAPAVFYAGQGNVRWVASIRDVTKPPSPDNYYGDATPGDPYEGEMFTWMMDLFSHWDSADARELPWIAKRAMLKAVNFTSWEGHTITVQRGFWYSAHENWKLAFLPYLKIDITAAIFRNCELARTRYSADMSVPGMYACVNDVTTAGKPIPDYVSNVGIPQLAYLQNITWRPDLITPYSVFPVALVNTTVALVWYHNMLLGPRMQGPYGSTEAINVQGTEISPLLTWDSKITSVVGLLGGVMPIVSRAFSDESALWNRFAKVVQREHSLAFGDSPLVGHDLPFALPTMNIPTASLGNFTGC